MPNMIYFGIPDKAPVCEPILIEPTTPKVKWYEFWKWNKISQINKQRKQECLDLFLKHFGSPDKTFGGMAFFNKVKQLIDIEIPIQIKRGNHGRE